jgi:uncharacterized protein YqjF (DUF2071 family)
MQEIDRLSPTLEPNGTPVMHQNWHHLLFLHWEVPPMELQPLLPPGLELDTFEGKSYVGLVPFTMTGVRPILVPPLPLLSSFHEVNVRTYVHRQGRDPGVWFFSLDASSSIAVEAARTLFKLPYFHSEIELEVSKEANPRVEFRSRRVDPRGAMPADSLIRYGGVEGPATPASPGTLDHFLVERYILYAADQQKNLYSGRVHHQPYPLQRADVETLDETLIWAAGIRRSQDVPLRHYAREVNVRVYGLERC